MNFEKDILISYAHIDDEALMEGHKGWIETFHRSLEVRLAQLLGVKPKIWRDPKLQGNDYFGDEIIDQFPQIALLISVISPRYVKSEWCVREVNEFIKACKNNIGVRVQNKSRIFKIVKTPTDLKEHPEDIQGLLGYDFYKVDPQTGRPKEFSKEFGAESELAFWSKLNDVAHDISDLLKSLQTGDLKSNSTTNQNQNNFKVYLAETSYDLTEYRDSIKRELQEHGYAIYPDRPLPLIASEYKDQVKSMMSECDLSIHLVGEKYGLVPEETDQSTIVLQNEVAKEQNKSSQLKRLIWMKSGLDVDDPRQKQFLERLTNDGAMQAGAEILETSIEDFKFTMHQRLDEIVRLRDQPEDESRDDNTDEVSMPAMVYLICDQRDVEEIGELEDLLFDRGMEVVLPIFDGEESQVRLDHQENLKTCDAVLIYYGKGNELWMRSKTRELLKIAGYGRSTPLKCKGVVLAGPHSPRKERFRAQDTIIINGINGINGDMLRPFLEKVNPLKR